MIQRVDPFLPPIPQALIGDIEVSGYLRQLGTIIEQLALHVNGAQHDLRRAEVTASPYTVIAGVDVLLVDDDTIGGAATVNLPAAADSEGRWLYVKKLGTTGAVTIDGSGSETIDGATTLAISTQYGSNLIFCDGTEWWTL